MKLKSHNHGKCFIFSQTEKKTVPEFYSENLNVCRIVRVQKKIQ